MPSKRMKRAQPITAATRFISATSGPICHQTLSTQLPKKPPAQPKVIVLSRPVGITIGISLLPMSLSKIAVASRIKKPAVRPELRREWLRRNETEGESPPEIAKQDGYDVRTVRKQIEIERQERVLTGELENLAGTVEHIEENLRLLEVRLEGAVEGEVWDGLGRLARVVRTKGHLDYYDAAQRECASPQALAEDITLCRRLSSLSEVTPEVLAVKSYLDRVTLRENEGELAMDRVSLHEQLKLENLLANPHVWPSVEALFDWFKSRYRAVYLAHHQDYYRETSSHRLSLENAKPGLEALRRLNSITELGAPLGQELAGEYKYLLSKTRPCPEKGSEVLPELEPVCSTCSLSLTDEPPRDEMERFLAGLRRALEQQHRRLSAQAIRQILAQSEDSRIDQFIKVIQTSDLSSLANVMDDELVEFLCYLLAEACTEPFPLLSRIRERFSLIEEGQTEEVVSEFRTLLEEGFAEAKRRNPGKRVQISPE